MTNPYSGEDVTGPIARYVRAIHIADVPEGDYEISAPPTGYPVLGHIFRGIDGADIDGEDQGKPELPFNHVAGPLFRKKASVRWKGGIGHVASELTAVGLYELFGIDGSAVQNKGLFLKDHRPDVDRAMNDAFGRLGPCPEALNVALEDYISSSRRAPAHIAEAVRQIEAENGAVNLTDVQKASGVSAATFSRQFLQIVGLPPKYFARVVQFNHVAWLVIQGDEFKLAELAAEAGYFDQAHFTRAMQEFVQNSPARFFESDFSTVVSFLRQNSRRTN